MTGNQIQFHPLVAAIYDPIQWYFERYQAPKHREYLARGVDGKVLEIAAGTGAMLPYFERYGASTAQYHAIEPDAGMWRQLQEKLPEQDIDVAVVSARAESLPYEDNSFDCIVECGLFCTVPSITASLEEIHRVLKPEGEFRFFDHVRSEGPIGVTQDWLTPLWRKIGGNCHLNREIAAEIENFEPLNVETLGHHNVGHWPVRRFVRGRAISK
jgi:ubiquinone/menaquinone biosynthesis C-methylase UbiE